MERGLSSRPTVEREREREKRVWNVWLSQDFVDKFPPTRLRDEEGTPYRVRYSDS